MRPVDLRSDIVTRPTPAMRRAMAEAEVGDAGYDDDPTVNRLQEKAAEPTGKEAAIYLVTGTMCDQAAMHIFTRPGHFVSCAANSYVCGIEVATSSLLSGIAFRQVPTDAGVLVNAVGGRVRFVTHQDVSAGDCDAAAAAAAWRVLARG